MDPHRSPRLLLGDLHVVVHVVVSHGVLGHVGDQEVLVNSTAGQKGLKDTERKCLDLRWST